ncbi:MAG: hypothetical protein ACJA2S_004988 [Cyclobacteriaceae bacterium]|jgi:hypothetical protein
MNDTWSGFTPYWLIAFVISILVPWLAHYYRNSYILDMEGAYARSKFYLGLWTFVMTIAWFIEYLLGEY